MNMLLHPFKDSDRLKVYRFSSIISNATARFVHRFVADGSDKATRLHNIALACKRHCVEATRATEYTSDLELHHVVEAQRTTSDLLSQYAAYAHTNHLTRWHESSPKYKRIIEMMQQSDCSYMTLIWVLESEEPEVVTNAILALCSYTNDLITQWAHHLQQAPVICIAE